MQQALAQPPRPSDRRWALFVLSSLLLLLLLAGGLVYVVDPYQHYRAMTLLTPQVDSTMQAYYNIGMARNLDYDTLLLGSSMTENTRPSRVEAAFGGQVINLPFSGGTLPAYARMMDAAFETRTLQRVFLCLDSFAMAAEPEETNMHIPTYLYDHNPLTDVSYLLSWDSVHKIVELLEYNQDEWTPDTLNLDTLYYWADDTTFGELRTLLSFQYFNMKTVDPLPTVGRTEEVTANIDQYLRPYIEAHPETEFILYLPPYSVLQWYSEKKHGLLERQLYYRTLYAEALLPYENVKLFDFQAHREWVEDLSNYKDMAHYSPRINDEMTLAMARGDFLLTSMEQLEGNNQVLREIAAGYVPPTAQELAERQERGY